jgi:hypothetical protein
MAQTKSRKKAPQPPSSLPDETPENLDKVRDILFGGQMRAVESRLARVEERLLHEQKAMRAGLEKQMASLEAYAKKELAALEERHKAEQAKRGDDLKAVAGDVKDGFKSLDKRLAKLDDATSTADAELRTQLLEHSKVVSAQIKTLADELTRAVKELRAEKTDTASLIEVFSEMAVRLSDDLQASSDS